MNKRIALVVVVVVAAFWGALALGRWLAFRRYASAMAVSRINTSQKVVALTFDDGPHPVYTPEILKILARYHIHATFFMIGRRVRMYPQVAREVAEAGDVIGNHTYTHPSANAPMSKARLIWELARCRREIERVTHERPDLFRPPKGYIDRAVLATAAGEGYKTILWSVCTYHHWGREPRQMAEYTLSHVRPGSIILAHDGMYPMRWREVAAAPVIIRGLLKRGYRFVTIPELLKIGAERR